VQYALAFRFFLDRKGGFVNTLLLSVCYFIPVVGPIVGLGYRAEVATALTRDPNLRRHPKFTFERFVEYLTRGVWPFLMSLVVSLPLVPVVAVVWAAAFAAAGPLAPNGPPVEALVIGIAVTFVAAVGLALASVPMMFHSELTAGFDLGGAFRFALAFWKTVGGQALLAGVVYAILSSVVTVIGLLCCFVGIYPASAVSQMAATHLMVQLYDEYLRRGGQPLTHDDDEPDDWDDVRRDDQHRGDDHDDRGDERHRDEYDRR
jgi:hypothetical protein